MEGGLLEVRDWRSGRQWKEDCWSGVTGAMEGSGRGLLEWRDWRSGRQWNGGLLDWRDWRSGRGLLQWRDWRSGRGTAGMV